MVAGYCPIGMPGRLNRRLSCYTVGMVTLVISAAVVALAAVWFPSFFFDLDKLREHNPFED